MKYVVTRQFIDVNQALRLPGEIVTADPARARKLLNSRLIGYAPEKAEVKKVETQEAKKPNYSAESKQHSFANKATKKRNSEKR